MRIGILTGGGDAPGLNAVIRAVVRKGIDVHGHAMVGFQDGWRGVLEGDYRELSVESTRGILHQGGTILGCSRVSPFLVEDGVARTLSALEAYNIDALVVIGGEGTLSCAARLAEEGVKIVGVPKTIDNDVAGTDITFGFDTAVQVASDAIDRLHTTAESHHRVMLIEVMGRHAGWIATWAGISGGADVILIPEKPFDIEAVAKHLRMRHARGRAFSIVVVAEGAHPQPGTLNLPEEVTDEWGHVRLGGIANRIAPELERLTGFETRVTILGHVQRGGTPTAFDRVLATRYGTSAIDACNREDFGTMVALRNREIITIPLSEVTKGLKLVDMGFYEVAEVFFGAQ